MANADDVHLNAIRSGDAAGLRNIYQLFLPRIARFIQQNGGSGEDAKDVFQEAIIRIYRKSKAPDFRLTSKFYTLLFGVCRNLWGNQLQKKSRTEVSLDAGHAQMARTISSAEAPDKEIEHLFWEAFGRLGGDCQQLLQLFFAKVKMEDIAAQLGISSVGYAKKKKFKCKEKLIEYVKADHRFAELRYQ